MEPVWYFISRALGTLIPLLLVSYAAGLWTGWIKWHTWKREYTEVERDYHKLHDIHDVARATIPELEQRRQALTDEIQQKEEALEKIREANELYEEESRKLNQSLRATKRNYEAMEDIWRGKIAAAEVRIIELETALKLAGGRDGRDQRDSRDQKDVQDGVALVGEGVGAEGSGEGDGLVPFLGQGAADGLEQGELAEDLEEARGTNAPGKLPVKKAKRPQAVS